MISKILAICFVVFFIMIVLSASLFYSVFTCNSLPQKLQKTLVYRLFAIQ